MGTKFKRVEITIEQLAVEGGITDHLSHSYWIDCDSLATATYLSANPDRRDTVICIGTDNTWGYPSDSDDVLIKASFDDTKKKIRFMTVTMSSQVSWLRRVDIHDYVVEHQYHTLAMSVPELPYATWTDTSMTVEMAGANIMVPGFSYSEMNRKESPIDGYIHSYIAASAQPGNALVRIRFVK